MNKNREQGTGNREQLTEEERHEAATEEAATVGCPSLGIPKLPGGFDGTEPAPVSEEARQKVEQAVVRQRQKLTQIADIALAAEAKSNSEHVKLGSKYLENARALCTIRNIVGPGLTFTSDGKYYTPGWLADLAKEIAGHDKPLDPSAPEMKRGEGRLFKNKHNSICHGTYIYDRICINDAHIRATLHPDNGGLEQHATIWIDDSQRCFCYCTFNTTSHVKCDYVVRGMLAGIAKRLVYHHKNLIKRRAKWAAAMAAQKGGVK